MFVWPPEVGVFSVTQLRGSRSSKAVVPRKYDFAQRLFEDKPKLAVTLLRQSILANRAREEVIPGRVCVIKECEAERRAAIYREWPIH